MIERLIRSGWWVVAAAVVVVAVVLAMIVRPNAIHRLGDGRDPATYGFDLECLRVARIVGSGMARDGLHALDRPATVAGSEVARINAEQHGKMLVGPDRVIGVVVGESARAYPLRLLRWHEVVNDVVSGVALAVTYSGLGDACAVWRRPPSAGGNPTAFAVSGLLYEANTLLYDRAAADRESSLWSQLGGAAVAGPAACSGSQLEGYPFELATWSDWFRRHPETDVMTPAPEFKRLYKQDPYNNYFGSADLPSQLDELPPPNGPAGKDRVVVVLGRRDRRVLALSELQLATGADAGAATVTVDGSPVTVHFTTNPPTARLETAPGTRPPLMRFSFWFAWHAQFPADEPSRPQR